MLVVVDRRGAGRRTSAEAVRREAGALLGDAVGAVAGDEGDLVTTADGALALGCRPLGPTRRAAGRPLARAGRAREETLLALDGRLRDRALLRLALADRHALEVTSTASDAELALAAWRAWGAAIAERLDGSWCAAIYERRFDRLTLVCDVLGDRRPALWLADPDDRRSGDQRPLLLAASNEAALLAHPAVEPRLDRRRAAFFFGALDPDDTSSFVEGVRRLRSGECLSVASGGPRPSVRSTRRLLDLEAARRGLEGSTFDDRARLFRARFEASVDACLDGARAPALLLSGGLDSSSIAGLAAPRLADRDQRLSAFSWTFPGVAESDESRWLDRLEAVLPLEIVRLPSNHRIALGDDPERWPLHPSTPEQNPFRALHEHAMERAAARGHDVLLSGMLGDQLSTGTAHWIGDALVDGRFGEALVESAWHLRAARDPRSLLRAVLPRPVFSHLRRTLRHTLRQTLRRSLRPSPRWGDAPPWLTDEACGLLGAPAPPPWPPEARRARRPDQMVRLTGALEGHGFALERAASRRAGLEARWPFRDRRLVELMLAAPTSDLYARRVRRPLHRAALRGAVPAAILARTDKATFEPLLRRGIERHAPWIQELLDRPDAVWPRYVDPQWLRGSAGVAYRGGVHAVVLWSCICFELWSRRAGVREGRSMHADLKSYKGR